MFRNDKDEYYIENDDDEPTLYQSMFAALFEDDINMLMDLLKPFPHYHDQVSCRRFSRPEDVDRFRYEVREAVAWACQLSAVDCVKELLRGPLARYIDLNAIIPHGQFYNRSLPLHYASMQLNVVTIDLLFKHGACADLIEPPSYDFEGLLPLNVALGSLRYHQCLFDWTPGKDSVFKLIFILCLPQTRGALEAVKLLANKTSMVESIFAEYLNAGLLLEAAVLLMAASDRILAPDHSSVCREGVTGTNLLDEGNVLVSNSATLLIEVFKKAGNKLKSYLHDQLHCKELKNISKDEVINDVRLLLEKAGFCLTDVDTDLSNINCESFIRLKLATEAVGRFLLDNFHSRDCLLERRDDHLKLYSVSAFAHPRKRVDPQYLRCRSLSRYTGTSNLNMKRMQTQTREISTLFERCMLSTNKKRDDHSQLYSVCAFAQPRKRVDPQYLRCRSLSCYASTSNLNMKRMQTPTREISTLSERWMLSTNKLPLQTMVPEYLCHPVFRCFGGTNLDIKVRGSQASMIIKLPKRCVSSTNKVITTLTYAMRKSLPYI